MNFHPPRQAGRIALSCAAAATLVASIAASSASGAPLGPRSKFDGRTAHGKYAHVDVTDCRRVRCAPDAPKSLIADLIVKTAREDVTCEQGSYAAASTVGGGGRITSTRRFRYTGRHVDRERHDPYEQPVWVSEEIRTTVVTGRFSADGKKVSGTYKETVDDHVVSGSPPDGYTPRKCDTGTVAYTAKRRR